MLRRMRDQADHDTQIYLYRVHLKPSVVVREGWIPDPGGLVGDVPLGEVCPPGVDIARYLNDHEDPGGLSLAVGQAAIAGVRRAAIPLLDAWDGDWVDGAIAALESTFDALVPAGGKLGRFMPPSSPRAAMGRDLGKALAEHAILVADGLGGEAERFRCDVDQGEHTTARV